MQDLHVLAADVDHGVHIREQEVRAARMAAQLAHLLVGQIQQGVAAITRCQDIAHVFPLQTAVVQHFTDGTLRAGSTGAHIDQRLANDLGPVLQNDAFGRGGTHVNAESINVHCEFRSSDCFNCRVA